MNGVLSFAQWAKSSSINENVKDAKKYLIDRYAVQNRIKEITPEVEREALDNEEFRAIREILKGNDGYTGAFVRFHFDHNASLEKLKELYALIKKNSASLSSLPMSIEEYSKQRLVNNVNSFEALMDVFDWMEEKRKHKWVIENVNRTLRNNIKSLSPAIIDRFYRSAQLIDKADEIAGDFIDPITKQKTNNKLSLLLKSDSYSNAEDFLEWVERVAQSVSNSDLRSKIEMLKEVQPEAGVLYNSGGYFAMSVRTEDAQKKLCSIANWCTNRGSWYTYGGQENRVQFNIFDFGLPITNPMHITGTTLEKDRVTHSHDKNDTDIIKSRNPYDHFVGLGYPKDLAKRLASSIEIELTIKKIVTGLGIEKVTPQDLLFSLVKSTYKIDLDIESQIRDVIIEIVRDRLRNEISRENILESYMKFGVISIFSARLLNILIPNLSNEEKDRLLNKNDQLINDPTRGFKYILSNFGRSAYPQVAKAVEDQDKIKDIIISGESID